MENYKLPVKKGDVITAKVLSLGIRGDGIVKHEGYVIFVKDGEIGKEYNLRITTVLPSFGFAEIIQDGK